MMPKFVTIGYGDRAAYDRIAADIRDAAHAADEKLKQNGAIVGVAGKPVQVRNPDAKGVQTKISAFMFSPLPIVGFSIIEAEDIAAAVDIVARTPCAVAHGVVEVWPLQES